MPFNMSWKGSGQVPFQTNFKILKKHLGKTSVKNCVYLYAESLLEDIEILTLTMNEMGQGTRGDDDDDDDENYD